MIDVLIVPQLTNNEELEEFAVSSLLLVSQKRPSVCFFSCASVKVRRVSLQQSLFIPDSDSGDAVVIVQPQPRLFNDIILYLFAYCRQRT